MRLGFNCSHCGSRANNLSLTRKSHTLWEAVFRCNGQGCGHLFAVKIEAVRALRSPMVARLGVALPMSRQLIQDANVRRRAVAHKSCSIVGRTASGRGA